MSDHVFSGSREEWMRRVLPSQSTDEECVLYWIHDNTCIRSITDGYVGVTTVKRFQARKLEHLRSGRFPKDAVMTIIHRSNIEGCYAYEAVQRPYPNMGWNKAAGGARGHKIGSKRSEETKRK
jgi:hypothetical protein